MENGIMETIKYWSPNYNGSWGSNIIMDIHNRDRMRSLLCMSETVVCKSFVCKTTGLPPEKWWDDMVHHLLEEGL